MGLFDFLKKKAAPPAEPATPEKRPGSYSRRINIVECQGKNEDGASRQKILSNIYHKKEPFNKALDVEMTGYKNEDKLSYLVSVNGQCVGEVESEKNDFIASNMDRLLGITDFKVWWDSPLDEDVELEIDNLDTEDENFDYDKYREKRIKEKDRVYHARMKIKIQSKN